MVWKQSKKQYGKGMLDENLAPHNPKILMERWMKEAESHGIEEPNAAFLATVSRGAPDGRVVLIKEISERGFLFFTSYRSKKAQDLKENPLAALVFFWPELERTVRLRGKVSKTSRKISDEYFHTRSRGSQISASISHQSEPVASRKELETHFALFESEFLEKEIPCPKDWGGFCLVPSEMEFWQGRKDRLHDRLLYQKKKTGWKIIRLSP